MFILELESIRWLTIMIHNILILY